MARSMVSVILVLGMVSRAVLMSARFSSGRSLSVRQLSLGHFCRRSVIYERWLGFIYIRGLKLNLAGPLKAQSA